MAEDNEDNHMIPKKKMKKELKKNKRIDISLLEKWISPLHKCKGSIEAEVSQEYNLNRYMAQRTLKGSIDVSQNEKRISPLHKCKGSIITDTVMVFVGLVLLAALLTLFGITPQAFGSGVAAVISAIAQAIV